MRVSNRSSSHHPALPTLWLCADIGKAFVNHYYSTFPHATRANLQTLFNDQSLLTWEGNPSQQFMGMTNIMTHLVVQPQQQQQLQQQLQQADKLSSAPTLQICSYAHSRALCQRLTLAAAAVRASRAERPEYERGAAAPRADDLRLPAHGQRLHPGPVHWRRENRRQQPAEIFAGAR